MTATAVIAPVKTGKSEHTPWRVPIGLFGPALLVAAAGIGASDIIAASVAGARFGVTLLWAVVLGAALKAVLSEGIARWQLTSGTTLLQGVGSHLPSSVLILFSGYLVVWTIGVAAALGNGAGLALENLTRGHIPRTWGAVASVLLGTLIVSLGGISAFTKTMKLLIVAMFTTIIICAVRLAPPPVELAQGFVPTIPNAAGLFVLSLVGGIGGSMTLLTYNYLPHHQVAPSRCLRAMRIDIILAYTFTALFGIAMLLIASRTFHAAGATPVGSDIIRKTSNALEIGIGPIGFYVYAIGFLAAVFASLIGTWQTIPLLIAECYALLLHLPSARHAEAVSPRSAIFRKGLALLTVSGIAFAFVDRPLALIVGYTIVASFVVPFIAAVLLYLNAKADAFRLTALVRAILLTVLAIFLVIAVVELFV